MDNEPLLECHALNVRVIISRREGVRNRLFIDEVQLCMGFEKAINSIHARGGWDIYLTGANAFLLSSDLATLFTGRHREVHVLPFSFKEYREYFGGGRADLDDDFDGYIARGGLARSYKYAELSESYGYIRDVYRTILTRDLVQKFGLSDTLVLERLAEYMIERVMAHVINSCGLARSLTNLVDHFNNVEKVPVQRRTIAAHRWHAGYNRCLIYN